MGNKNKKTRNIIGIVLVIIIGLVVWSMISTQSKWQFEKLGLVEYGKGNYKEAIKYYTRGIESDPGNASSYNNRGLSHFKLKEYKKAVSDYSKAVELKTDFAAAYCNRGLAHFKSAKVPGATDRDKTYGKAILDFTKAIEFDPKLVDAYYNRGLCYSKSFMGIFYDAGKPFDSEDEDAFQRALADFDKALELDPGYALAFAGKGSAYYRHGGEYDKADAEFARALKLKDEIAKRWGNEALGAVYANTGRNYAGLESVTALEKAASCYEKAAELGKLGHGAWVYGLLRNYNKALEFRNKRIHLIEKDPEFKDHKRIGSAYAARGKTYYLLGQYDKARADFNKALASGSIGRRGYGIAKVHRFLGKIYLKTGKEQDAKKEFNKAIALYTSGTESKIKDVASRCYSDRGRCYFNLGEYDKAISGLEKAIALNAPSYPKECPRIYPMALKNLGVVYWKMGNRDKANEYFKKSIKLFEERQEGYYAKEIKDALKTGDVSKLLVLHPS